MFKKIQEYDFYGLHCSFYENEGEDWIDFCRKIVENGYEISYLEPEDSLGDVGMKYGSGTSYSTLDEFERFYPEFSKYCDSLCINLKYACTSISIKDYGDITMTSADRKLDLNDIVAPKEEDESARN